MTSQISGLDVFVLPPILANSSWLRGAACIVLVSYLTWQFLLRNQMLWNGRSEPPMLPYLVPFVGHSVQFVQDTHKTLVAARSYFSRKSQPFSVYIGGRRTYVVMDPRDIAETYKKTQELNFDAFVNQVMGYVGVSDHARMTMWSTSVPTTNLSVPNSIRSWVRQDLQRGPASEQLYADFLTELDQTLHLAAGKDSGSRQSLLRWTGDIIVTASTNALFGPICLQNAPELLEAFHMFNHHAWKLLFQYPRILSATAHDAKDGSVGALTKYFDLPRDQRKGAANFILQSEDEMRRNGIDSKDIAAVLFKLYWAINGNPSILAFWFLGHILYSPDLMTELRAEVAPAFEKAGRNAQPDLQVLLTQCPKLNAAFYETMRIHGGASTFRRVVQDTVVAGYEFKAGCDVMMPYRQLHLNDGYWGQSPEKFDIQKFVDDPKLATAKTYKPFGGGATYCPGRFLAQHTALSFMATILTRFDIHVVGGLQSQKFPEMDDKKPTLGIISPIPGDDVQISIKAVV